MYVHVAEQPWLIYLSDVCLSPDLCMFQPTQCKQWKKSGSVYVCVDAIPRCGQRFKSPVWQHISAPADDYLCYLWASDQGVRHGHQIQHTNYLYVSQSNVNIDIAEKSRSVPISTDTQEAPVWGHTCEKRGPLLRLFCEHRVDGQGGHGHQLHHVHSLHSPHAPLSNEDGPKQPEHHPGLPWDPFSQHNGCIFRFPNLVSGGWNWRAAHFWYDIWGWHRPTLQQRFWSVPCQRPPSQSQDAVASRGDWVQVLLDIPQVPYCLLTVYMLE